MFYITATTIPYQLCELLQMIRAEACQILIHIILMSNKCFFKYTYYLNFSLQSLAYFVMGLIFLLICKRSLHMYSRPLINLHVFLVILYQSGFPSRSYDAFWLLEKFALMKLLIKLFY